MKSWMWLLVAGGVCLGAVFVASLLQDRNCDEPVKAPDVGIVDNTTEKRVVEKPSLSETLGVDESDIVEVGGVKRPKRDLIEPKIDYDGERAKYLASKPKMGNAPTIGRGENAQVDQLFLDAGKSQKDPKSLHPARSIFASPEPFDREAYLKAPETYLSKTRPGRVFQSSRAGEGIEPLAFNSISSYREILQGESVLIEVKAQPKMPVTFHTQQLGEFDNRLKTISVAASDEGIAKVKYKATTGTVGSVRIMASSPVHSGQLVYLVNVNLPN